MLTNAGSHTLLDNGWGGSWLSAHSSWPGEAGSNEVSGGSPAYARKQGTFGAAGAVTNKQRQLTAEVSLDIPGTPVTVRFIGRWSAESGGSILQITPNGGSEKTFTVDTATGIFTVPNHGYTDSTGGSPQYVVFMGGAPGGLTEGTLYHVRDATTNTFRVANSAGGSALSISGQPPAACRVSKCVESVYSQQGTFKIAQLTQSVA